MNLEGKESKGSMSWRSQGKFRSPMTTFEHLLIIRDYVTCSEYQNRGDIWACGASSEVELIGNEQIKSNL